MRIDNPGIAGPVQIEQLDANEGANDLLSKDAFLQLLVAQLRNQDPLDPMDPREMVTQLSELTTVEKLESIDDQLQSLGALEQQLAQTQASSLVGQTVSIDGSRVSLTDTGDLQSSFNLARNTSSVEVEVRDSAGALVQTLSLGAMAAGDHAFNWDGRTAEGPRAPAGSYTLNFTAKGTDGHGVVVDTLTQGQVSGVVFDQGRAYVEVGAARVPLEELNGIVDSQQ